MNPKAPTPAPPSAGAPAGPPPLPRPTLLGHLRHLLGFARGNIRLLNHRLNQRYRPAADFPLQVTVYLAGGAWHGALRNMSGTGLGLLVDPVMPMSVGQAARVGLELGQHHLDIKARIAHMEIQETGLFAGIELKFADFPTQKAYLELMHPVVIGQSLRPAEAGLVAQDEPGLIKQCYLGESDFRLLVWREDTAAAPLHGVEFQLHHYSWRVVRPPDAPPGWIPPPAPADEPRPEPIFDHAGGLRFEVHELFRWIAFNLSEAVPADVRAMVHPACD